MFKSYSSFVCLKMYSTLFWYLLQDVANQGVMFLCNFVHGQKVEMPEELKVGSSGCLNI